MQKAMAENVFGYAKDKKKASGRALGTFVEILTFYLAKAWNLEKYTAIERRLPEYANPDITHNVEFSLHPVIEEWAINLSADSVPLTSKKIFRQLPRNTCREDALKTSNQLLSSKNVLRNASTVWDSTSSVGIATLNGHSNEQFNINVTRLHPHPFAVFECKRVGVEEGAKKGPQTIEKAKQGAYVARTVSSLQKIRLPDGALGGLIHLPDGTYKIGKYTSMLRETVESVDAELLREFTLTVGVVSNHGNWFTSEDHNKELKVLAQSYDWLIFLTDPGLAEFVEDVLLAGDSAYEVVRNAFLSSYGPDKKENKFTKVKMDFDADRILQNYFADKLEQINGWFNVISPHGATIDDLRNDLSILATKDWSEISK